MDVCSAQQHVLLTNMFSQHVFLFCLSSFYLSLLNPSVLIVSVSVCMRVRVWMMTQSVTFDTVQKKDDENQGEKPNIHLSQTWADKHSHHWPPPQRMMPHMFTALPPLLCRSTSKWHLTRVENVFCTEYAAFQLQDVLANQQAPLLSKS